jgi:hypothetical protein
MKVCILLNLRTLKLITLAWDCFGELEYYAAYDPDPVNTLLTMSLLKPIEYLIEYLPQLKNQIQNQVKNHTKPKGENNVT